MPREYTLETGLTVRHLHREGSTLLTAYLVSKYGGESYPAAEAGLGRWATHSLKLAASNGLEFTAHTDHELGAVGISVERDEFRTALRLLAGAVIHASPSDGQIETIRTAMLTSLRAARQDAVLVARDAAARHEFRFPHYLGAPDHGDPRFIADSPPELVRSTIASRWSPQSCVLVVVADVSETTLDPLIEEYFAELTSRPIDAPDIPRVPPEPAPVVRAYHDGSDTSALILVDRAPSTRNADHLPFKALSYLIGGHYSSRLNTSLRLEHALTYGVHAHYEPTPDDGTFRLELAVGAAKATESLHVVINELEEIHDAQITEPEVERAKRLMASAIWSQLDHDQSATLALARGWVRGQAADHFNDQLSAIRTITHADVTRVAREWLHPRQLSVFLTGDMHQVRPRRFQRLARVELVDF